MIRKAEGDTLFLELFLSYHMLNAFEVMGTPDIVFGSKEVSVSDFDFIGKDRYLLMVYEKRLQKGSKILLTDYSQQTLSIFTVPDEAKEFYSDYLNRKYLICKKKEFTGSQLITMSFLYFLWSMIFLKGRLGHG